MKYESACVKNYGFQQRNGVSDVLCVTIRNTMEIRRKPQSLYIEQVLNNKSSCKYRILTGKKCLLLLSILVSMVLVDVVRQ